MGNKMNVDKYTFRIAWTEEDACHVARCLEFPSCAGQTPHMPARRMMGTLYEAAKDIPCFLLIIPVKNSS